MDSKRLRNLRMDESAAYQARIQTSITMNTVWAVFTLKTSMAKFVSRRPVTRGRQHRGDLRRHVVVMLCKRELLLPSLPLTVGGGARIRLRRLPCDLAVRFQPLMTAIPPPRIVTSGPKATLKRLIRADVGGATATGSKKKFIANGR